MNCQKLQFNLSIYLDDILPDEERSGVDDHLAQCPNCRQKLADYRRLRRDLRMMPRPVLPAGLLNSVRNRVAEELSSQNLEISWAVRLREWKRVYLMPYSVGTAASLIFGFALLWSLLSASNTTQEEFATYRATEKTTIFLTDSNPKSSTEFELTPADFARQRFMVSSESPSINPQGALVALTKSFVRGEMNDDEVVIVADVFGDGLAQIADVVEPSKDRRAVRELEKALRTSPDYAPPFVPADMDHRSKTVRVVLKFHTVNVDTTAN